MEQKSGASSIIISPLRYPRNLVIMLIALSMMGLIACTDYFNSLKISVSILYLIPISYVTYHLKFRIGIIFASLAALAWLYIEKHTGQVFPSPYIPLWNSVVRITYFTLHSFFLSRYLTFYKQIQKLSLLDPLTSIANRRGFHEKFHTEFYRAKKHNKNTTLVYFDLDNFKTVNDTLGHAIGDEVLKTVVEKTLLHTRSTDIFARLGGDEFAIILPETNYHEANIVINRIFDEILAGMKQKDWPVGISLGAFTFNEYVLSMEEMIRAVDGLMYKVKQTGKGNILHLEYAEIEP